jgi:DNA-binding CsgD family transcriptional regulator
MRIAEALSYATEGLAEARVANDPRLTASALQLAGTAGGESDAFADYIPGLDESLAIWRQLGDASNMAATLDALVRAELQRGSDRARELLLASVRLHMQTRDYATLIGSFVGLLYTAMSAPDQPNGARYAAQALGMMKTWEEAARGGDSPWAATRPREFTETLTAILGPDEFARAFAEGRAITLPDLTPFAQAVVGLWTTAAVQVAPDLPVHAELTPREREVLALVADGLTNAQIAERLVVTPRTINAHLTSVYSKLGVTSRAGAIRYALEHRSE